MKRMNSFCAVLTYAILAMFFTACGGGTTGTDGGTNRLLIMGQVQSDSSALTGGSVVVLETGDRGPIESDGTFAIDTTRIPKATFLIELGSKEGRSDTIPVDSDQTTLGVSLGVSISASGINVVSISVVPLDDPETPSTSGSPHTPMARPAPSNTRTPIPTPGPLLPSRFSGQIVNFKGEPLPGILVSYMAGKIEGAATSDATGHFAFTFKPGTETITLIFPLATSKKYVVVGDLPSFRARVEAVFGVVQTSGSPAEPGQPVPAALEGVTLIGKGVTRLPGRK